MQDYRRTILSTRPLSEELVQEAREHSIRLDAISFIDTEAVQSIETQQEIELAATEFATVVFTSMNAVNAVIGMLNGEMPEWRIYCLGHQTKELVEEYFGKNSLAGTADNAGLLADEIIENAATDELIFFCGNQRRDELPQKLRNNGIEVNEIVVYETTLTPKKLDHSYDAILFFSPSAVDSFFLKNKIAAGTILFAIGETTGNSIQKHSRNKLIISDKPGKARLVEQAIRYFDRD